MRFYRVDESRKPLVCRDSRGFFMQDFYNPLFGLGVKPRSERVFYLGYPVKHFRPGEFECQCYECGLGFAAMDVEFLDRLEMARIYAGTKFLLTSAIRCEKHNKHVNGSETSAHLKGLAVDIHTPNAHSRNRVIYGLVKAGFHRYGVYENYIHVDDDPSKAPSVTWLES